jgi:2EXR family
MIWKQACSVTRVVDIWAVPLVRQGSVPFFKYAFYEIPCSYKSHCEPPAILHATRESRSVGLESYSLAFEWKMERQLDGMNFTIQSPANIYINWEFDVLCPMPTPYLIDEHQILDDTVFGKVWNDFTRNLPQLRRIALDSDSAWWIPYILNEGPSELHEIILYKGEEYLPTEFEREDPIMLTFTEWKEEFDDISEYLAMASTELLKAAEEVEDAIKEHRELQGHGITALMHGSIEPTVKLVDLNVHQE